GYDAATHDPVQLFMAAREPLFDTRHGCVEPPRRPRLQRPGGAALGASPCRMPGARATLLQRVPLAAQGTLPLPLHGFATTGSADKYGTCAGHLCAPVSTR